MLFEIDPRPYQAQLDQAVSQVGVAEAQLQLAKATHARAEQLLTKNAISQQEVDQDKAAVDQAEAQIKAARANVEVFKLNLAFTKVTSPIDGQVSRFFYTFGNLILQDQTLLTTVVSVDPMYSYFDMDERTILRVRAAINNGRIAAFGRNQPSRDGVGRGRRIPAPRLSRLCEQCGEPVYRNGCG